MRSFGWQAIRARRSSFSDVPNEALGLLHARVAEHQLDDADVDAAGEQSRGAFVAQVVPVEIDLSELLAVPEDAFWPPTRFEPTRQQP